MWKRPRFERLPLSRSTILRLVESLATSCYYACFSCTLLLTPKFVSNPSRHSGIPIIFLFHSYWQCTLTLRDVSFVTLSSLLERLYREIRSRRETKIVQVVRHPYGKCIPRQVDAAEVNIAIDAMEIQFSKPSMKYKAGQWLFLNCPSVSRTQWHPFTITSCPFDPYISVHVRRGLHTCSW
jgi:predicted ferric reductase